MRLDEVKTGFDSWAKEKAAANRARMKIEADRVKLEKETLKRAEKATERSEKTKRERLTQQTIWSQVENSIVWASFPDGDPSHHLAQFMDKHDLTMKDIDSAIRKHTRSKGFYDYLADMWDDMQADRIYDAKNGHVEENSPFYSTDDHELRPAVRPRQIRKLPNPWRS